MAPTGLRVGLGWVNAKEEARRARLEEERLLESMKCLFGQETKTNLSSDQNPGYLLYRGDYTTQLYGDCNKPL